MSWQQWGGMALWAFQHGTLSHVWDGKRVCPGAAVALRLRCLQRKLLLLHHQPEVARPALLVLLPLHCGHFSEAGLLCAAQPQPAGFPPPLEILAVQNSATWKLGNPTEHPEVTLQCRGPPYTQT